MSHPPGCRCPEWLTAPITEADAKRVVAAHGIAVPRGATCADPEAAGAAARELGGAVAVKLLAAEVAHKSDVGGVRLGLSTPAAARAAAADVLAAAAERGVADAAVLVEAMAPAGHELVIGGVADSAFGPLLMLGFGGIFVEVYRDVSFRICPIEEADAREMLDELTAAPIVRGARGGRAGDEQAIVDALLRVGGRDGLLVRHADRIAELDVNPLIVSEHGAIAADAHIVLRGAGA